MFRNLIRNRALSFRGTPCLKCPAALVHRQLCTEIVQPNIGVQTNRLRRAVFYCPGNDQRKIDKVRTIAPEVDSIVLDCEDGVAFNRKEEARTKILETLNSLAQTGDKNILDRYSVRINSMQSGLAEDDMKVIFSGDIIPRTIYLPKVDTKADLDHFVEHLQEELVNHENGKKKNDKTNDSKTDVKEPIDLIIFVESANGLLDLRDICKHALEMSEYTSIRLAGIVFGSDDFCANIGATRTDNGREVLVARQKVILVAKALELQAIDTVFIDYKNLDELRKQSLDGASMGFTGKQAIHPAQVPIIQDAFSPSDEKIQWAKGLVDGFETAQKDGKGAFVYHGQMIDMPLLKQAYNILIIAKSIGKA